MKRIERLTSLLSFLQSRRFSRIDEIVNRFQTSERTIYRDLRSLDEAGVPISFQKDNGYFILEGHFLPPLSLTKEEAKSFVFLEQLAKKYTDQETCQHFSSALEKIKNKIKTHDLADIEHLESNVKAYIQESELPNFIQHVESAISAKQALSITYADAAGKVSERIVEPIGMTFYSQTWHLIAYCQMRNDYRDFSLSRIQSIQSTNQAVDPSRLDLEGYIKKLHDRGTD